MTTPPRFLVLNEAEAIVRSALAGATDDPELALLTKIHRVRERRADVERRAKAQWQKTRSSPFFTMIVAYVVMIIVSYVLPILLRALGAQERTRGSRTRSSRT